MALQQEKKKKKWAAEFGPAADEPSVKGGFRLITFLNNTAMY